MNALILVWFFIFGTIIGSFLNVVIYRFNTGKSLNGRSHCLSCGTSLSWYELVPVLSYLAQRGICRSCRARITPRYLFVELLTGLLFLFTAQVFLYDAVLLLLNLGIVAALVVILVYDLRHTIIPDTLVLYLLILALVYLLWDPTMHLIALPTYGAMLDRVWGGLIPAAFFGGLWLVSRGRWIGLGDAKLAFPLGLIVGLWGSISMLMLAFWIGAIVSVGLLLLQKILRSPRTRKLRRGQLSLSFLRRRLTIQSEVPFAPFLIAAFFLVHLLQLDAFAIITAILADFIV